MSSDFRNTSGLPPMDGYSTPYPDPAGARSSPQRSQPSGPANVPANGWGMPSLPMPNGPAGPTGPGTDPFASTGNWMPMAPGMAGGTGGTGALAGPNDILAASGDLLTASKQEYEKIAHELDEIRLLIKQSVTELEKLNQRKVLAAAKTREMEEKIETFSRQEIRSSYLASSEAEMRAFMMSEQRDQLQAKEKAFERYQRFLKRAIDVVSSLAEAQAVWQPSAPPGHTGARSAPGGTETMSALARVIQAQEEVRQRVAQRLHDGPAQSLANVVLTAEICEKLFQSDPKRAQSELGNLKGQVNATLQDTRKFIFELRPMTLDDLGLVPTLRRYVTDVGARYQVQASLMAPQGEQRLPGGMEVPIFRVAQEAITNAVQHGHATQVRVTIALKPEGVVLTVEDNGSGFDVEHALAGAAARQTTGLASMQERAEMLGGWLRIESARGHGSRVELSVPMR